MRPLAVFLCCLPAVLGISSGNTSLCDAMTATLGCTQWGRKIDPVTNLPVENRLNCSMPGSRIMAWTAAPVRSTAYTVRSGNGVDPASDVAFYNPGEYVTIFVRATVYRKRYRGLMMYALDPNGNAVGRWEFPQETEAVPFWTPTYWAGLCFGGRSNAVLHHNADEKPYTVAFRWKAPPAGTGLVTFKALFKDGPANEGYFYWPNGAAGDLKLSERNVAVDGPVPPLIWFKAVGSQTCATVCSNNGRSGVDTTLMQTTSDGGEGTSTYQPSASQAFYRSQLCRNPPVSSCAPDVPAVDAENFCLFAAPGCASEPWRNKTADSSRVRFCACTTSSAPPSNCPADQGWPATAPGATASLGCAAGQTGNKTRSCSGTGVWNAVIDTCVTPATCTDRIQNQGEFAIDCGGTSPCPPCLNCPAINCGAHGTCVEGNPAICNCNGSYTGDRCQFPPANPCQNWTCTTPTETAPPRGTCTVVQPANTPYCACNQPFTGEHCEIAPAANCVDGVQNQGESGIDCGGPCRVCDSFFWEVGVWGNCDKPCGGGTQTRGQTCKNSTGQVQPNSACAGIHLPQTTQSCNPDPCAVYSWVAGPWQNCSSTCGSGNTQVRSVDCWSTIGPSIVTQPGLCPDNIKPATSQTCNTAPCTANRWVASNWNTCDRPCGGGLQTRVVQCKNPAGDTELDPAMCPGTAPPISQACNIFPCVTYSWYLCPGWGPCTATCNGGDGMLGQQFRDLYCVTNTNGIADFSLCDPTAKPITVLTVCNTQRCNDFNWMANGDWSSCNGTHRTRGFHCHAADGTLATIAQCQRIPLPVASIPCTIGMVTCPPLITSAPTASISGASTLRAGLPLLMALLSTMFFSPRATSYAMGMLIVLSLVGQTEAHNWLHTPGRASFQASTVAPCQGRKDSDLHAQVAKGQRFTIKFATGHERESYFVTIRGEDADYLGYDNFESMIDEYLANAVTTGNEDHLGTYTRRYHGYPNDRGNAAAYDDQSNSIGAQFNGQVAPSAANYPRHNRSVAKAIYNYKDSAITSDRRAAYSYSKYPWILSAARLTHLMHLPDDFDALHWTIPTHISDTTGHFIVHWRWSGYYDCIDVDLQPSATQYPDGLLNTSQHIWSQVDHCQYEQPIGIMTQCMEVFTDVAPCIRALGQGSWNENNRYGLNVVPFRNPATVGLAFQNEVEIPWRNGACSSSWNLLRGPITESTLNWGAWDAKTNIATGMRCTSTYDDTSNYDLRRAVGYCVSLGSNCVGITWEKGTSGGDVHVGNWHFRYCRSTATTADANWNTYTPKALSTPTYNTGATQYTVNFSPKIRISPTPVANQINDGGDMLGTRQGATFGWLCNTTTDCSWCCDNWQCTHGGSQGCCNMDPLYTYHYGVNLECPQQRGVRKHWQLAVANGVYDVTTRHYADDGGSVDISGCNVEGARMIQDDMGCVPSGTETTQRIEVTDGQLTLNGDGGHDQGCWYLNLLRYKLVASPNTWPQTWMPDPVANPTWEQNVGSRMPIGLVTLENYNYWQDGEYQCGAWWLFKGSACYPSRPMNYFINQASEGAIVGVSNSSCASGSCPGAFVTCGWVTLPHAWETRHYVDCNGAVGQYVFVRLPGAARHLVAQITAYRFLPDVPANENPMVCYAVEARPTTTTSPEFIISLDPEDPIFYSTCYVRNPNVIWINTPRAVVPDRWRFAGRCVSCESFEANKQIIKTTPTALPRPWVVDDGQCTNCYNEKAPVPKINTQWVHTIMHSCDDPATSTSTQITQRGLTSCAAAGITTCQKQLFARGRTDNEPTWGSSVLTLDECMILGARDPECGPTITYAKYSWGTQCKCQRSHSCCGRCTGNVWGNPTPNQDWPQTYEYGNTNVDPVPDPFCLRGLKSADNSTCCPLTCKSSTGVNVCGANPYAGTNACTAAAGGGQCCRGPTVSTLFNLCSETGFPCRIR